MRDGHIIVAFFYWLPPLAPPLIVCPGSLAGLGLVSGTAGPGPGYAFMMLANVAGTDGGDE